MYTKMHPGVEYAIVRANRAMVSQADAIICHVTHAGNTRDLLDYARRCGKNKGLIIENLGIKQRQRRNRPPTFIGRNKPCHPEQR